MPNIPKELQAKTATYDATELLQKIGYATSSAVAYEKIKHIVELKDLDHC